MQLFLPSNASAQDARVAQDIAVLNYALKRLSASLVVAMNRIFPGDKPMVLAERTLPLAPVQDTPGHSSTIRWRS